MKYNDVFRIIEELDFDIKTIICKDDKGVEVYLIRPSELPKRLKNKYDVNKNFQIWLKVENREFRPNHLRLMIDLNLRTRSRPDLKKQLLTIFDNIFYGADPEEEIKSLDNEIFDHYLNSLKVIATLAQLFIIEQEFNYNRESNFDPKTLFFQGWVRECIDSPKEIDNMCMSISNGQSPKVQYTDKENKKNKKYEENLDELWYL
ncbi:MAG: hypothetical protein K0B07_03100 [DPANN group archaeon]|nr:hypothetical protein [DPANN group archaeon]